MSAYASAPAGRGHRNNSFCESLAEPVVVDRAALSAPHPATSNVAAAVTTAAAITTADRSCVSARSVLVTSNLPENGKQRDITRLEPWSTDDGQE